MNPFSELGELFEQKLEQLTLEFRQKGKALKLEYATNPPFDKSLALAYCELVHQHYIAKNELSDWLSAELGRIKADEYPTA